MKAARDWAILTGGAVCYAIMAVTIALTLLFLTPMQIARAVRRRLA